ncbi:MAG TPA: cytochrome c3 family protein, partial [bacterium]|nr:cytochrome c3 family protein [bacterium]
MKRKKIKVEFLLPVMLVLIGIGGGGLLVRPASNPDVTLPARIGDVPWNHELHSRMKDYNCTTCHHTERPGVVNPKPCSQCHALPPKDQAMILADIYTGETVVNPVYKTGEQGPPAMQAYHAKCLGCHNAVKKGPTSCRDCHRQTFIGPHGGVEWSHREHSRQMGGKLTCLTCHHQDTEAVKDGDYRACRACHQPLAELAKDLTKDVPKHEKERHLNCAFCHTTDDPEVGAAACTECHPNMDPNPAGTPDDKKAAPSLEQALHKRCLECHNAYNPDLSPNMPGVCTDCHQHGPGFFQFEYQEAGPAVWSHTRHSELVDWTCDKCHHKDEADPQKPHLACFRCHGQDDFA